MTDITAVLNVVFVALIAFYVCFQCAICIFEVRSAETSANSVPASFRKYVTLAVHRKAVDYTGEVAQCDLVAALVSASIALMLTLGGGLNLLLVAVTALFSYSLFAQFFLLALITLFLTVVDFPLAWWKDFRVRERYGYERTPPRHWVDCLLRETLLGWAAQLPALYALLYFLSISAYNWWIVAFILCTCWFVWRILIAPNIIVGFSHETAPLPQGELSERITLLLEQRGWKNTAIVTIDRPESWRHGNALIARKFGHRRLVIFNHVLQSLTIEETLAVVACAIGRVNRWHNAARLVFFIGLSFFFWSTLSFASEKAYFYAALGIDPELAIVGGAIGPGLILVLVLAVFPVALYPLVFLLHGFTRMLDFDDDSYAVQAVGAEPLVRALVKLHQDYRNTLTPNLLYSIANHRRPHISDRIRAAWKAAQKLRLSNTHARRQTQLNRLSQFNAMMSRRRDNAERQRQHISQVKLDALREATSLRERSMCLQTTPGDAD